MFHRFSKADQICAGGSVLTVVAAFLPWFHSTDAGTTVTVNAFRSGVFGDIVFLAAAAMLLLLLIRHGFVSTGMTRDLPEGRLFLGCGVVAVLATVVQIAAGSGGSHSPAKGLLVGLAGLAAMAAGGWMQYQDDTSPAQPVRHRLTRTGR